jgi:hypothetical protein
VTKIAGAGAGGVADKTHKPCTPTGVAVFPNELSVLEYDDETPTKKHGEWPPRVTKVVRNGSVATIAVISRESLSHRRGTPKLVMLRN